MADARAPIAIVAVAARFDVCRCPTCLRLDKRCPGQGVQLALFPYRIAPQLRLVGR